MKENRKPKIWQQILFALGIIYVAATPALFYFVQNAKEPAIFLLISGILLAILSRFDDVSELGLFGLKAKIELALNDAYATLEQVKAFAKISATASLSNTARSGWWGGIPDDRTQEIFKSTQETLKNIGCSSEEIYTISSDFHDCLLCEYRQTLLGGGISRIPETNSNDCQKEWEALRGREVSPPVLPEELENFFKKYNFATEENQKRVAGYAYYYKHKEFDNYEDYKNRRKWPHLKAQDYEEKRGKRP